MTLNMGTIDRAFRAFVVVPAAVVVAFVIGPSTIVGIVLFVIAAVMLATATTGFCPTYVLLGISTRPNRVQRVGHHIRAGHA